MAEQGALEAMAEQAVLWAREMTGGTRVDQTKTGGAWSMRRQVGPMVTHSGADGGRSHERKAWLLQGANRLRRSRWLGSQRRRRRDDEPGRHRGSGGPRQMAPATEAGIQKAAVEPERQRTEEEPKGWRSLTEPEGRGAAGGVESRGAGWSATDQGGAGGTREPGGTSGQMRHGREEGARSHGGAARSAAEAESGA